MNRIKELRIACGLKQKNLADRLNVSVITVSRYEMEQRQLDPKTILKLCDIFGVTADYLLCRSSSPTASMTDEEAALLRAYRAADARDQNAVALILAKYQQRKE